MFMQMPLPALTRVVSRIKVMGRLDIADRLRPQDGRARIRVNGGIHDLRISTVPTREAEKAVVRLVQCRANVALLATFASRYTVTRSSLLLNQRTLSSVPSRPVVRVARRMRRAVTGTLFARGRR